jgi:ABC-type uncharacterized transport system permease subunit
MEIERTALLVVSVLATTFQVATPLTLGALSGLFCERSGVVNIAIEGMMLAAAFFGYIAGFYTKSLYVGLVVAIATGGVMALLHALLSVSFRVDQIISGTVINILAIGVTGYLNTQLFFGSERTVGAGTFPRIALPLLADLPIVGRMFDQRPITYIAPLLALLAHFILFSTRWGLRTRAVGEYPRAADTVGINVPFMRYANVIIGGLLAGLAGAYFTLESIPQFEPMMTSGRGFISLAALIFGKWTPLGAWGATLLFGLAQAIQINAQQLGVPLPSQIVGMFPYLLTMIVLSGVVGRSIPPAAVGQPYQK